jgi:hypothetical protein
LISLKEEISKLRIEMDGKEKIQEEELRMLRDNQQVLNQSTGNPFDLVIQEEKFIEEINNLKE